MIWKRPFWPFFTTGVFLLCAIQLARAQAATQPQLASSVCAVLDKVAVKYGLPSAFFTRLIWRESGFRVDVTSPAGAQGIAQFMPSTAASRGLLDPFARDIALDHSAAYLKELRGIFGNIGLAAAAYNAGPGRVMKWLAGQGALPRETIDYVRFVSQREVETWMPPSAASLDPEPDFSCAAVVASLKTSDALGHGPGTGSMHWAIILVGSQKREAAVAEYGIVRASLSKILGGFTPSIVHRRIPGMPMASYFAEIETETRRRADDVCARLKRGGGSCFVVANQR